MLRTVALDGLEGRILRRLTADKHATSVGTDVYQAVRAIVPESRDPFGAAVSLPLDDIIIAAGYLIKVPHSPGGGTVDRPAEVDPRGGAGAVPGADRSG